MSEADFSDENVRLSDDDVAETSLHKIEYPELFAWLKAQDESLGQLYEILIEAQFFTVDRLCLLRDDDISTLFPALKLRYPAIKLRESIKELKRSKEEGASSSKTTASENTKQELLVAKKRTYLDNEEANYKNIVTVEKPHIIFFYEKSKKLTRQYQTEICNAIVSHFMKNRSVMNQEHFQKAAREISELFVSEDPLTYYTPPSGSQSPSGLLYDKYNSIAKKVRKSGYLQPKYKQYIKEKKPDVEPPQNLNSLSEKKTWLNNYSTPWTTVEHYWKETVSLRTFEVSKGVDILNSWVRFKDAFGWRLIEIDFSERFNASGCLLDQLPSLSGFLDHFQKNIRNNSIFEYRERFSDLSNDSKCYVLIWCLHNLLAPNRLVTYGDKNKWKPTITDSLESMIAFKTDEESIQNMLEKIKKKYQNFNINLQPLIICCGTWDGISSPCMAFDDVVYTMSSMITAIDVLMKVHHVLDISYSVQGALVHEFLQRKYFNFLPLKRNSAKVTRLLNELK